MPAAARQPAPVPGSNPGPHGPIPPTPGQHVTFRHPSTGEASEGHIHAQGAHGATVVDGHGVTHRLPHGMYMHAHAQPAGADGAPKPDGKLVLAAARKHLELGPDAPLAVHGAAAMLVVGGVKNAHALETQQIGFEGGKLQVKPDKLQTAEAPLVAVMQQLAQKNPRGPVFVVQGKPITEESLTTYVQRFGLPNGAAAAPGAFAPPPGGAPAGAPAGGPPSPGGAPPGKKKPAVAAVMAKASASALDMPGAGPGRVLKTWHDGDYTCEWRRDANGIGCVTIRGSALPVPLHEVVSSLAKGESFAREAITALRAGRAPNRGIFQATR